jgi:hypothetical protein
VQVILLAIVIEDSLFFAVWEYELISISSSSFTSSHLIPELAKNQSFKLPDTEGQYNDNDRLTCTALSWRGVCPRSGNSKLRDSSSVRLKRFQLVLGGRLL